MRHTHLIALCLTGALTLSACQENKGSQVSKTLKDLNVVDESNLNDVMLNAASPGEAVTYFRKSLSIEPERLEFLRGLAKSLTRDKRATEGAAAWKKVVAHKDSTNDDRVDLADALIRAGNWKGAKSTLDSVPPTHETYKRYRLEAMVADSNKQWKKADSFYETAMGLTTNAGNVLNNWGYSKLSRGDFKGAERLFGEALSYDKNMFTAKNNLVLARGAQRKYTLPVIPMTQIERAQLLHSLGLSAIKQGDVATGKGLLKDAIDTHPQHFEAASRSLAALENNVLN